MSNRRELLRMMGIAPLAATHGLAELKAMTASPAVGLALNAAQSMAGEASAPRNAAVSKFGPILGAQINRLQRLAEEERGARGAVRGGQIDADILSMKSLSHTSKQRKMLERYIEENSSWAEIYSKLWG